MITNLYNRDFNEWAKQTAIAIKNRDIEAMDWENLLEEIEDMSKSEKRSLESYLERLIEHILKLQYWDEQKEQNTRHWQAEVVNFRNRIKRLLKRSPSLKNHMTEVYTEIYQDAVASRKREFDIPENNNMNLEEILKEDFFG
jgi:ABC-type phosphate transport system auxiliary subunit